VTRVRGFVTAIVLLALAGGAHAEDRAAAARAAFEAGDYAAATAALEAHLADRPDDHDARVLLGWALYRSGVFDRAGRAFDRVLDAAPDYHDARVGRGYVRLQLEGPDPAAETFRRVLAAHPDNDDARRGLVFAGLRDGASRAVVDAAREAAEALLAARPDDPVLQLRLLGLQRIAGGSGERRLGGGLDPGRDVDPRRLRVPARAGRDYLQVRGTGGAWRNLFVKGFNLGMALPGRFPTQFPEDEATYRQWLSTMADLGANTVRLYTLPPPAFYRALVAHNAEPGARRLWLIQGVWTGLPPRHDFSDPGFVDEFRAEIARVIDAVHGDLLLAPRPGHVSGRYDTDASAHLLAMVIGREWEPFAVVDHNALYPGETAWEGRWLRVRDARAMECWVARMCDFAVDYEARRHGVIHPVTFANWPTLDPLHHPTESTRAEEDAWRDRYGIARPDRLREAAWEDDRVTLDATRIEPTDAMRVGFFASYHIYPNYPDFLNLQASYASGRDAEGPSRYAAYLEELEAYHGDQPVLVAEFGISTSRGIAHVQPHGWHHGGLDEREQGRLVGRMMHSIRDAGYAGAIVFEFLDEWFKGTWSVAPLESPAERRRMWFNAESPEQSYGVLAARPGDGRIRVDGDASDWEGIEPLAVAPREAGPALGRADLKELRVTSDEGYLYLLLRTGSGRDGRRIGENLAYRLSLDTYDPRRGARRLPAPGATRVGSGTEFLVELGGPERSTVRVVAPYEPFRDPDAGPPTSPLGGRPRFAPLMFETNRERFARDGTRHPAERIDRGRLRWGSLDPASPAFDTRTDVAAAPSGDTIELRLPWGLLNVADPSTRRVLHGASPEGTVETPGVRVYAFAVDPSKPGKRPLDRLPWNGEAAPLYSWDRWEQPEYRLELKHGAAELRRAMNAIPDTPAGIAAVGPAGVGEGGRSTMHLTVLVLGSLLAAAALGWSSRRRAAAVAAVALFAVLSVTGARAAVDVTAADAAFDAGDHATALARYDEVLAAEPDHVHALVRSGMLLSWSRRFDEAVRRYDRVLELQPDHGRAALERAKVLSWDRRYREAASSFETLLAEDPASVDARLGLARSLSWDGRQEAARREYLEVLEREPRNAWATLGVAQTWAWSGHPDRAREWYGRALDEEPGMKEAVLGLAYLDIGEGRLEQAAPRVEDLATRFAGDDEVADLERAYRRAGGPWVQAGFDTVDDTDDNDLDIYRIEAGWAPFRRVDLRFGAARYDMDSPGRSASIDSLYAVLGWRPAEKHRLDFRIGNDDRENSLGQSDDETIGGITWTWDFTPGWKMRLSAAQDSFRYSTDILDGPGNTIETYEAWFGGRVGERWRVHAAAGLWDISDGNARTSVDTGAMYLWSIGRTRFETGYVFRYMDYDDDLDNGYFDPSDFTAHLARFRARDRFGKSRVYWDATLEAGIQSFTQDGVDVSQDQVYTVRGLVGVPIAEGVNLELYAMHSDFALQSGSGFESDQLGLRLRWQPGR
jgi:tetratricopeptide (TPR) repeat protein